MRSNGYFDEGDYDHSDQMLAVAAHCPRFARRRDVTAFNMTDYRSCENCRHLSADNQCAVELDNRLPDMH
ncbi:MAG: hypothetical protein Q4C22_07850 [Bacillota bacterium]|nr:hypothetical protein [Bacillota bacterium]